MLQISKLKALWSLAALCAAIALNACTKTDEAIANASAAAAPSAAGGPLKVAFVYLGPVGDGGWTFAHDEGRKQVEAEFGDRVKTGYLNFNFVGVEF